MFTGERTDSFGMVWEEGHENVKAFKSYVHIRHVRPGNLQRSLGWSPGYGLSAQTHTLLLTIHVQDISHSLFDLVQCRGHSIAITGRA